MDEAEPINGRRQCKSCLLQQNQKKRFLHVQPIFGLIERDASRRFHHFIRHFQAALGRQAMHKECIAASVRKQSSFT